MIFPIRKSEAESFLILQALGKSGKHAAELVGSSQSTLNRYVYQFRNMASIRKLLRLKALRFDIFYCVRRNDCQGAYKLLKKADVLRKAMKEVL